MTGKGINMIAVLQVISSAFVDVDGATVGKAGRGLMILLGCSAEDTREDADLMCDKISGLRVFTDENDKMNLSIGDIGGEILLISNFTLSASCRKGRRPDFGNCMKPAEAEPLFDYFRDRLISLGNTVETGIFGADMKIEMHGDGPVTIVLDSNILKSPRKS